VPGTVLSLLIVGFFLVLNSWFFAAMCLMAGAFVVTGSHGRWREWLIWGAMLLGFSLFASLRAAMGPLVEPDTHFLYVIRLDTLWGLIPAPTNWLQEHLQTGLLNRWGSLEAFCSSVYLSFFIVPQMVVVYLWRKGGPFSRYVAAACLMFAGTLIVHLLLPTAPPWMAADKGLLPHVDRIIIRLLTAISPALTEGGYQASANDVAAMPSLHLGLTVLAMVALADLDPRTRWTGWIYSLLMLFSITYLGEHYVVDGVAGVALALGGWWLVGKTGLMGTEGPEAGSV
jgi:hypothetical protein